MGKLFEELRRVGPRKLAIITVLAVIAVIFAYGNNSTNDAANGKTLPRVVVSAAPHAQTRALKP